MQWIKSLRETLLSGKYCWKNGELQADEFFGANDTMGFLDHVASEVSDIEKKAYMAGYLAGCDAMKKEDETIDVPYNQITAERSYLQWRK